MSTPKPHPRPRPRALPRLADQNTGVRRGDVWMVAADPEQAPIGNELWSNRPAIVVSNNTINANMGAHQVVYLTTSTRKRSGPTHVSVPKHDGPGEAIALCEQVHTVDTSRLLRKLGETPTPAMHDITEALAIALTIRHNPDARFFRKWEDHIKEHGVDMAEEIRALAGQTTDERVEALTRALRLTEVQRNAYRELYEASCVENSVRENVQTALSIENVKKTA